MIDSDQMVFTSILPQTALWDQAIQLLTLCELPVSDLGQSEVKLFGVAPDGNLLGVIGMESYGNIALLRSMAVDATFRSRGVAAFLVTSLLDYMAAQGVDQCYLLTNTAETYFHSFDFHTIGRNEVPDQISNTKEYSSICPDSSTVMLKRL